MRTLTPNVMKIYTVIPFMSDGTDVNLNDVKSFTDYDMAYQYVVGELRAEYYNIVENEVILK
jgi:hypothetical protein